MEEHNFKKYFKYNNRVPKRQQRGRIKDLNYQYLKANKEKSYGFLTNSSMFSILERVDKAMLNSILSFSIYEKNTWMMTNLKSELSDMTTIVQDAMKDREKMYGLKIWHFMKNTFEKIPDHELKIPAEKTLMNRYKYETHFYFKDGQYSAANGLAHASVLKSKSLDGDGEILHLTFRGTEFSRLNEYIKGPYLDMSAYYEHFKPLVKYIRQYVNNPNNNITELHVNGHSLGGAMVQEFLKNNPPEMFAVPIKGFTFGSPGSQKKWYSKLATLAYHSLGRGIIFPTDTSTNIDDVRITQFFHNNDPVPLIGLLGYNKGGNTYQLPDITYEDSKKANLESKGFLEKIPAFGKLVSHFKETILNRFDTKFHDSARYIMNLRNHIESHYKEYPEFGQIFSINSTKNWQNFLREERNFSSLTIKYKSAFEYLVKQDHPNLNADSINEKILKIRENMKHDSEADIVLSKVRSNEKYYKFLQNVITLKKDEDGNHSNNALTKEHLIAEEPLERIKRLRTQYGEKMEAREAVFKKI